ncbi:MAG: peptidylprolyl isomerase [Alphaproteobacteria bacterium]
MRRHTKSILASCTVWAFATGLGWSAAAAQSAPAEIAPTATARKLVPQANGLAGVNEQRIAAIVNDEVISYYDLDQRMKLVISSSGYTPSEIERRGLEKQVLRNLIDEKLKFQETRRLEVGYEQQEIVDRLQRIAQGGGTTVPDIQADLERRGISVFTLTEQIKADLVWNKLVQGRFGREVKIDEKQINEIQDEARASVGKAQYDVVEIFLPIDNPNDAAKVEQQAKTLIEQLKKGVPFPQLAQQFSQAPSAASGGQVGWVTQGQMPAELDTWLKGAHRGALSLEPVRTVGGYYILGVRDTRNVASGPSSPKTPLFLKRIVVRLPANASTARAAQAYNQLKEAAARVKGCNTLADVAKTVPGAEIVDIGTKPFLALAQRDQVRLMGLVSGQASPPADRTNEGYDSIVLCGHAEEQAQGVMSRDEIADRLYEQQLSMYSRRYLRDLRRDAVIDNRLGED